MVVAPLVTADVTQFSLSVILCRRPTAPHPPAADNNGTSGPYWPVSCYRCAIPSSRSPSGCSSCLCLLIAPHPPSPHPPVMVAANASQTCSTLPVSHSRICPSPRAGDGRSFTTTKCLLIKIPLLFLAFDFPKVSHRLEVFSSQN